MRYFVFTTLFAFVAVLSGQALAQGPAVPSQVPGSTYDSSTTRPEMRQKQETPGSEKSQLGQSTTQQQVSGQQLSSQQVLQMQYNLKDRGFDPGQIDGIMGPNTRQAIRQFQRSQELAITGTPNQPTLRALNIEKHEYAGAAPAYGEQQPAMAAEQGQPKQSRQQAASGQMSSQQQLNSQQVRLVQQSLKDRGFDPGPIDGIMGPNTRQAIKRFQQDQELAVTGQPNQQTLNALNIQSQEFMGVSPEFGKEQKQNPQKPQPEQGQQKGQ